MVVGPRQGRRQTGREAHQPDREDHLSPAPPPRGHERGQTGDGEPREQRRHDRRTVLGEPARQGTGHALVADIHRAGGVDLALAQARPEGHGLGGLQERADHGEQGERERRHDGDAALPDEDGEDDEEQWCELDGRREADEGTSGNAAGALGVVGEQVDDDERHEHRVDLAVADGRTDRLHREHQRRGEDAEHEPARHPDAPQDADQRGRAEDRPEDLPHHVRPEQQGRHEDGGDGRVDELEVVARRAGQVDVPPVDHVLDGEVVDAQVDRVRVVRPEVALGDDHGEQHERHDQRREPLGCLSRKPCPDPLQEGAHAVICRWTSSRSLASPRVRFGRPGASS